MRDTVAELGEREAPARRPGVTRRPVPWPILAVGAVVLFNLVVLRAEARPVQSLNDASIHRSMVAWAEDRWREGHLPLDGWYPDLSLGSSRFHHYQSLPHVLTGLVAVPIGSERAVALSTYLLMAFWPFAVYAGGRLLGWGPWVSAIAAVCSPLIVSEPGLGYEWGSYAWRGYGTWSQLWGMWALPFAWGLSWRAVSEGRRFALAALAVALSIAVHLLTGYLALVCLAVFVLARWREIPRRVVRAGVVGLGSLLVGAWVIVPLLADRLWTINDEFSRGKIYYDSFGARRILGWLATGELFDRDRIVPLVTILVAVGLVVALRRWRREERARVLVGLFVVSLVLFFGRSTLGSALRLLPGSGDLFLRRFVFGVHLTGLYLAGLGAVRLGGLAIALLPRLRIRGRAAVVVAASAGVLVLSPAFGDRAWWAATGARWIEQQAEADATDGADVTALVELALDRGPGRFYGGMRSNWGSRYEVGQVPMYAVLLNHSVEGIGFTRPTWSLSSPIEYRFLDTNLAHHELFAVRYLILDRERPPPVDAEELARRGRHVLYEVEGDVGYVALVDVLPPIEADRTNLGAQVAPWLRSELPALGAHPGIAFAGHPAPPPTAEEDALPKRPAGVVLVERVDLRRGVATATVELDRPAMVMLKTSFDPRWQVRVDGVAVEPQMIAPSFVGRVVPAGRHVVRFEYVPYPRYDLLLLVGAATLAVLASLPGGGAGRVAQGPVLSPTTRSRSGTREASEGSSSTAIRSSAFPSLRRPLSSSKNPRFRWAAAWLGFRSSTPRYSSTASSVAPCWVRTVARLKIATTNAGSTSSAWR
jgi:hypothetical protein